MHADPMHIARLANLEGALLGLLRAAAPEHDPNHQPDEIIARLSHHGLDIELRRGGIPVEGYSA